MIDKNKIEEAKRIVKALSERLNWLEFDYNIAFANLDIEEPSENGVVKESLKVIEELITDLKETLF